MKKNLLLISLFLIGIISLLIFTYCSEQGQYDIAQNESVESSQNNTLEAGIIPPEEQKIPMTQRIEVLEVPPEFVYTRRKTYDQNGVVAITLAHKNDYFLMIASSVDYNNKGEEISNKLKPSDKRFAGRLSGLFYFGGQ